jgi:hypothetical protein
MNGEQVIEAGGAAMANLDRDSMIQSGEATDKGQSSDKGTMVVLGAGLMILVGLALQWIEALSAHFISENSWFFATLFSGAWNMINVWLSAAQWHQDVRFWPLLLVITGGAILFSRTPRRAVASSQSQTGARKDA